jgi:hypothetical protein
MELVLQPHNLLFDPPLWVIMYLWAHDCFSDIVCFIYCSFLVLANIILPASQAYGIELELNILTMILEDPLLVPVITMVNCLHNLIFSSFVLSNLGSCTLTNLPSIGDYISKAICTLSQLAELPSGGSACWRRDSGNWVSFLHLTYIEDVTNNTCSMGSFSERI